LRLVKMESCAANLLIDNRRLAMLIDTTYFKHKECRKMLNRLHSQA